MAILNFRDFLEKNNLKNDTLNESELQKIYNYTIYPRDSKKYLHKAFLNIDDGSQHAVTGRVL